MSRIETYLGDGVYASYDGYHLWLRSDGGDRLHEIALEPPVLEAFEGYVRRLIETARSPQENAGE